jgi:hypothetical protein
VSTLQRIGIECLVIALLAGLGAALYQRTVPPPDSGASVLATPAAALRHQPTAKVPIKAPVTVYQGETKAKLKLPEAMQKDERQQVIGASQIKADLHPQTVSTVINTETGEVQQYVKIEPYPWFAIETRGVLSVAHGYKSRAAQTTPERVTRLAVGYDVIRVKALAVGVVGTIDSDREGFAGVQISYRW